MRGLLLALAAGGVLAGFVLGHRHDRAAGDFRGQYVCPMHSEVTSAAPGECPICGMALVPSAPLNHSGAAPGEESSEPADSESAVSAAQLLRSASRGGAPNLITYNPAPVRSHSLRYELYAPAWLEEPGQVIALFYVDELASLELGERAGFVPTATPSVEVKLHWAGDAGEPWDRSLSRVRFVADADLRSLPLGTVGWLKLGRKQRQVEVVPAPAVLQSPLGPYVLVFSPEDGTLSQRPIQTGKVFQGLSAVVSGVRARELVVSTNTFFWDAERRLQTEQGRGSGVGP